MNFNPFYIAVFLTFNFINFQLFTAFGQNITGTFADLANQQIKLVGFNGFDTYTIDSAQANEKGSFICHTPRKTSVWLIFYQKKKIVSF